MSIESLFLPLGAVEAMITASVIWMLVVIMCEIARGFWQVMTWKDGDE